MVTITFSSDYFFKFENLSQQAHGPPFSKLHTYLPPELRRKMHKKLASKPLAVMERTVPKSAKYANVQSKLNTGLTVDKVRVISAQEYARRRDEVNESIP